MTSRCAVGVVSDKYRFGDVGALLNRPKWLRFKPALTFKGIKSMKHIERGAEICFLALFFIVWWACNSPAPNTQPVSNSQPPAPGTSLYSVPVPPDTITLTAKQLEMAYGSKGGVVTNMAAADATYKGKLVLVSGEANSSIYNNRTGFKAASPGLTGVQVSFQPSEESKLANLFEGDSITVLCRGDGVDGVVPHLADCLLQALVPGVNTLLSDQIKATLENDGVKLNDQSFSNL